MNTRTRNGFALFELLVLLVALAALSAVAAPTLNHVYKQRMKVSSASNLRFLGGASAMYTYSNDDQIHSYTWEEGETYMLPNGSNYPTSSDFGAAQLQNRAILMEMTGRISPADTFRNLTQRLPHRRFVHLVLWQFMGPQFSTELFVDPLDRNMTRWHRNPRNISASTGSTMPYASGSPGAGYDNDSYWRNIAMLQRWGYSSSYNTVPAAYLQQGDDVQYRPYAGSNHVFIPTDSNGDVPLNVGNRMSTVAFPANKVYMFEEYDRRQAIPTHYAYDHSAPMKLMFDGSLNTQISGDAGSSYDPVNDVPWRQAYIPLDTYPLAFNDEGDPTQLDFRYRWTRGGLFGIDYAP